MIVGSAFQRGFSHEQNVKAWEKVGAVPLSRRCLSSPKVRRSIGDGTDNQQALVYLLVEHNTIACNALTLEGFNGDVMKVTLKPLERTNAVTAPHTQERIELLSDALTTIISNNSTTKMSNLAIRVIKEVQLYPSFVLSLEDPIRSIPRLWNQPKPFGNCKLRYCAT